MKTLLQRWRCLCAELDASNVQLLAVSKYALDADVRCLMDAGQVNFGESKPQNLRDRAKQFPHVNWHMIGPLQKNKAKYIGRHAFMWHSVEDIETAKAVAAHVQGRQLPVMLQVNVASIIRQHGVDIAQVPLLVEQLMGIPALKLRGLMCMASRGSDAHGSFGILRRLRDELVSGSLRAILDAGTLELCMGMSHDYRIAIEEGSSIVRLGSILFGAKHKEKGSVNAKP